MKKLVIVGIVCLGLSGIAFAGQGGKWGSLEKPSTTYSKSVSS